MAYDMALCNSVGGLRSSGRFRQGDLMKARTRPCFSNRGGSLIHEFKQITANRRPKMLS